MSPGNFLFFFLFVCFVFVSDQIMYIDFSSDLQDITGRFYFWFVLISLICFLFSSAWLCQQSYCRGTGIRPFVRPSSSVKSVFSETALWLQDKFYGQLPFHHISRLFSFINIFYECLGDLLKIKNCATLWNFNMGVNGKILKYIIFLKQLIVEQKGLKCGTCSPMYCICRVLFMSYSFSSIWGHPLNFAKFPAAPTIFIPFQPNVKESMWSEEMQTITFSGDLPIFK